MKQERKAVKAEILKEKQKLDYTFTSHARLEKVIERSHKGRYFSVCVQYVSERMDVHVYVCRESGIQCVCVCVCAERGREGVCMYPCMCVCMCTIEDVIIMVCARTA